MTTATLEKPAFSAKAKPAGSTYPLSDAFFNQAITEAIREALLISPEVAEQQMVRLKPNFSTACWAFLPPHRIYIGTGLFNKDTLVENLTELQQKKYIHNHYHHERAHALYTERNMEKVKRQLKAISAPFQLFNLFEDARIEARYRKEAGYLFKWFTIEKPSLHPRAESLLFALIQAEGDIAFVKGVVNTWKPAESKKAHVDFPVLEQLYASSDEQATQDLLDLFERVVPFYERTIAAKDCTALMPVIADWLTEFGKPPEMPESGLQDVSLSALLMTSPSALQEFEEDTVPIGSSSSEDDSVNPGAKADCPVNITAEAQNGELLSPSGRKVLPKDRIFALARKFEKMFISKTRYTSTEAPQKRFSAKNFCANRPFYRKKDVTGRASKNIFFLLDCSGSMQGYHIDEARVIIAALSVLAQKRKVKGHVLLSAVKQGAPVWQRFAFPLADSVIERIYAPGSAEGLEYNLTANLATAKNADYVFVYTDGNITDAPMDKPEFHKQGVFTWGLYAGDDPDSLEALLTHFDKAVLRKTAEEIVDTLLVQLK